MSDGFAADNLTSVSTGELLERVGMLTSEGEPRRSNPLSDPPAFRELASRLAGIATEPYDLIVVRDLFGDRVLGYQLSLISGRPVTVSHDVEGMIVLGSGGATPRGGRALIAADVHFTPHSIQAAASGIEQAGLEVAGGAILLQIAPEEYAFPIWTLEDRSQNELGLL
jgi:hypothetical protein